MFLFYISFSKVFICLFFPFSLLYQMFIQAEQIGSFKWDFTKLFMKLLTLLKPIGGPLFVKGICIFSKSSQDTQLIASF